MSPHAFRRVPMSRRRFLKKSALAAGALALPLAPFRAGAAGPLKQMSLTHCRLPIEEAAPRARAINPHVDLRFRFGLIRGRDAVQHCASHPTHPLRCHTSKLFLEVVAGNHRSGHTVW